jgi:hypothetical protein
MNFRTLSTSVLCATLGSALVPAAALASSHREAPSIADDPAADNTDLYAWVKPGTHDKMYILANFIPLEEPAGGPNFHKFSDDVRYEVHIARGANLDDAYGYYIFFNSTPFPNVDPANLQAPLGGGKEFFSQLAGSSQTYSVYRVTNGRRPTVEALIENAPVAPVNIGPRTQAVLGRPAYDDAFAATFIRPMGNGGEHGRVFAGPRDDGFYVDLGGVFDLANLRGQGEAQDGVSGYNTHTIALEIPTTKLTKDGNAPGNTPSLDTTLGVWAAASRRQFSFQRQFSRRAKESYGQWVQVSRLGLPLINEVVIGLQDKDKWNSLYPKFDVQVFGAYFLNPVIVRDAEAVGIYTALGVPQATVDSLKSNRLDIINTISLNPPVFPGRPEIPLSGVGDVLRVDIATDSGFPNGRPIPGGAAPDMEQADVTDVLMTVVLAGGAIPLSDGVQYNDKPFLTEFPFLAAPHEGRSGGHGRPTPAR